MENQQDPYEISEKYLTAMGIALGIEPRTARENTENLLSIKDHSKKLYEETKGKEWSDLMAPAYVRITDIGESWLPENMRALKFTVGSWVLALLHEDPTSDYYKRIEDYINRWTDGQGGSKFKEALEAT